MISLRIFQYIDLASNLLPILIGWNRRKVLDRPLRLFLYRVVFAASADAVSMVLSKLWIPNAWFVQSFHCIDVAWLFWIFSIVARDASYAKGFRIAIPVYAGAFLVAKFTFEPMTGMDQYTYTVASLLLLVGAILVLLRTIRTDEGDPFTMPWFWVSMGLITYFASNLVLFSVLQWYTTLSYDEGVRIWTFHWIGDTLVNVIYLAAFLRVKKP
jgi:hypothetical protein